MYCIVYTYSFMCRFEQHFIETLAKADTVLQTHRSASRSGTPAQASLTAPLTKTSSIPSLPSAVSGANSGPLTGFSSGNKSATIERDKLSLSGPLTVKVSGNTSSAQSAAPASGLLTASAAPAGAERGGKLSATAPLAADPNIGMLQRSPSNVSDTSQRSQASVNRAAAAPEQRATRPAAPPPPAPKPLVHPPQPAVSIPAAPVSTISLQASAPAINLPPAPIVTASLSSRRPAAAASSLGPAAAPEGGTQHQQQQLQATVTSPAVVRTSATLVRSTNPAAHPLKPTSTAPLGSLPMPPAASLSASADSGQLQMQLQAQWRPSMTGTAPGVSQQHLQAPAEGSRRIVRSPPPPPFQNAMGKAASANSATGAPPGPQVYAQQNSRDVGQLRSQWETKKQ